MDYNINDILPYIDILHLDSLSHFTADDAMIRIENYYARYEEEDNSLLLPPFQYDEGCTKLVIIPSNLDYVIKIPFSACVSGDAIIGFENGGGDEYWDYCALEMEIYLKFKEYCEREGKEKFINFLLPIEQVISGPWDYPVYIQAKVVSAEYCFSRQYDFCNDVSINKIRTNKMELNSLPNFWLASCLEKLNNNIDALKELCNIIKINNIDDLHCGNVGFYNNFPVIIDYGGYSENY